jgi:primosomal protein N''
MESSITASKILFNTHGQAKEMCLKNTQLKLTDLNNVSETKL